MDTLCIPVNAGKSIRRKAIAQMNFTFAGADNVLVLDPVLRTLSKKSVSKLQLRVQVACSIWMTRCWTFQEACLARAWHVALRTTLYEPAIDYRREVDPLYRVWNQQTIWTDEAELEHEAVSFYGKMWPLVDQDPDYKPPIVRSNDGGDIFRFTKIWNELDQRSTTRRQDRLIILAILLDLDAGEIMSLKVEDQMKAVLGTQKLLPLSLLFEPQLELAASETKCGWIPLYPEGSVSTTYGCMTQNHSREHYHFTLADIKANGFILDAKHSHIDQGLIHQTFPYAFKGRIRISARADSSTHCTARATCIILSRMEMISSSRRSPLIGARFVVQNNDSNRKSYTLLYDSPLIYQKITSTESLSQDEYPQLQANPMPEDAKILIDCGKLDFISCGGLRVTMYTDLPQWYLPRNSRAKSLGMRQRIGLQSPPYVGLISGLIFFIWLLAVGIGTALIALAMFKKDMPLNKIGPAGFPLLMLGAVFVRTAIFLGIESHLLYKIVGERQYYRWASSFSGVNPGEFVEVEDSKPLSYQYRPWWIAVLLILGATALLVTGVRYAVMLWATIPGAALLAETVIRFGLEILWLRTPFGTFGKEIRLRWLPWLTIPVGSYR